MLNNEERLQKCKEAIEQDAKGDFSAYALSLLHQGYLLQCGKRGGLYKKWIGHVRDETEHYAHLRDVYEHAVAARKAKAS